MGAVSEKIVTLLFKVSSRKLIMGFIKYLMKVA